MDIATSFLDWVAAQPLNLQPAYIAAGAQGIVVSFGLLTLIFTIIGNAWANRRNTRVASREQQKLTIYKEVLPLIDQANEAIGSAGGYARGTLSALEIQASMLAGDQPWPPLRQRVREMHDAHFAAHRALSSLHRVVEQWAIVDRRLEIFGKAFSYQGHQTMMSGMEVLDAFRRVLPVDIPGTDQIYPYVPPENTAVNSVRTIVDRYSLEIGLLDAYVGDFSVELQPLLLGHLFGKTIARRDPPDPSQFAIRLDQYGRLRDYFDNTEYFRAAHDRDREIRAQHLTPRVGKLKGWVSRAFKRRRQ